MLDSILGSQSRAELFRLLFNGAEKEHYLRELEKETKVHVSALQKELKHLESLDLLTSRLDGNRVYYRANPEHPLYLDIHSIVEKTTGAVAILNQALVHPKIKVALLFGSIARGEERAESDVDLLIIGDIGLRALVPILKVPQMKIDRPINPIVYTTKEFSSRLAAGNPFLTRLLERERVKLVGEIDDIAKTVKKRTSRS
jgi:predicted nucleotidyltransferase